MVIANLLPFSRFSNAGFRNSLLNGKESDCKVNVMSALKLRKFFLVYVMKKVAVVHLGKVKIIIKYNGLSQDVVT